MFPKTRIESILKKLEGLELQVSEHTRSRSQEKSQHSARSRARDIDEEDGPGYQQVKAIAGTIESSVPDRQRVVHCSYASENQENSSNRALHRAGNHKLRRSRLFVIDKVTKIKFHVDTAQTFVYFHVRESKTESKKQNTK